MILMDVTSEALEKDFAMGDRSSTVLTNVFDPATTVRLVVFSE
jgi:hypothetical protein